MRAVVVAGLAVCIGTVAGFGGVPSAAAQVLTGSIQVNASDAQGGVLPGVRVTVSSPALLSPVEGVTDERGAYVAPALPPADYVVRVERAGFAAVERRDVRVGLDRTTTLNVVLEVAGVRETVVVEGHTPTIDVTSANLATDIDRDALQDTPGGRDVWSLLEYKAAGVTTDRVDVGGSEAGLQAAFVAHGTSHGQNTQALNGVNVSDPVTTGFSLFYYDYDALDEIQVSTGAHPVEIGPPGVYVNVVTRGAADRWTGDAAFYFQNDSTQSDNIDQGLLDLGVEKAGFDYLSDFTAQGGGPLGGDRVRLFGAVRNQRVHRFVPGFVDAGGTPVVEATDMRSVMLNGTFQANPRHRVTAFWTRQDYDKPQRGASALVTPLTTRSEEDVFNVGQGLWNGILGDSALVRGRVSYVNAFAPFYLQEDARTTQPTVELTTGAITGSYPVESIFRRRRLQANLTLSVFGDDWLSSRHELTFGWDFSNSPNEASHRELDDVILFAFGGVPVFAELDNTPINPHETVRSQALFASDTVQFGRASIYLGARFERTEGIVPEQTSPAGSWAPARTFPSLGAVADWTSVSPRAGLVYQLTADGRTAFKVSGARYYHQMSTLVPASVNPNGPAGDVVLFFDFDGNGQFEPGEAGPTIDAFGGLRTSIDPDLKAPLTDELIVTLEREVLPDLRLSGAFTLRRDRRQIGLRDTTSVWIPTAVQDPETGATLTVFDKAPSSFGAEQFEVVNSAQLDQDFRGFELVAQKRLSDNWQLLGSYSVSRAIQEQVTLPPGDAFGSSPVPVDPNDAVNARGPTLFDRTHVFKASASYLFPLDVLVSGNVRAQSGPVFTRMLPVNLNQGPVFVFAEPRDASERYDALTTVDLRASKILRLPNGRQVEVLVDLYNLLNANTVLDANTIAGPEFRTPLAVLSPRVVRIGGRVQF